MIWDEGTWEPIGDPDEGLAKGDLKFRLHGHRLNGDYVLVRMKPRKEDRGRQNWLLIKKRDDYAGDGDEPTEDFDTSVKSGRTMDQILTRRRPPSGPPTRLKKKLRQRGQARRGTARPRRKSPPRAKSRSSSRLSSPRSTPRCRPGATGCTRSKYDGYRIVGAQGRRRDHAVQPERARLDGALSGHRQGAAQPSGRERADRRRGRLRAALRASPISNRCKSISTPRIPPSAISCSICSLSTARTGARSR